MLELLRRLDHPNIVELYCTYTYHGEHSLLFPRMEMDLEEFFQRGERVGDFQWDYTFYTALCRLGSALKFVHNLILTRDRHHVDLERIGYHRDIKPRNVLVTASTFLLTDFGMAGMKDVEKGSQTLWQNTNSDYMAPECLSGDLQNRNAGRPVDIWALACLMMDTVSFMRFGSKGRQEAQERRFGCGTFPHLKEAWFFAGTTLKKEVTAWSKELQEVEDDRVRELVGLSIDLLHITPTARPNAAYTHHKISRIANRSLLEVAKQSLREHNTNDIGAHLEQQLDKSSKAFGVTFDDSDTMSEDQDKYQDPLLRIIQISRMNPQCDVSEDPIERHRRYHDRSLILKDIIESLSKLLGVKGSESGTLSRISPSIPQVGEGSYLYEDSSAAKSPTDVPTSELNVTPRNSLLASNQPNSPTPSSQLPTPRMSALPGPLDFNKGVRAIM